MAGARQADLHRPVRRGCRRRPGAVLQLPDPHRRHSDHARRELPGQVLLHVGVAFAPLGTDWPAAYQDALFFSDFLRGCIWRLEKDANGQPDPARVSVFAQTAGAPVKLTAGPGGDLYYVDYGSFAGDAYVAGSGGVHRIDYVGATTLTVKSSPKKVKIKVDGKRHKAPYRADFYAQTMVKLVAPKVFVKKGVRYVFKKWKGVTGKKAKKNRKAKLVIGNDDLTVKAIYVRQRRR